MTKKAQPLSVGANDPDDLLTAAEVAITLRLSLWSLALWRRTARGPAYIRFSKRGAVFYRRADMERWIESRRTDPCAPSPTGEHAKNGT